MGKSLVGKEIMSGSQPDPREAPKRREFDDLHDAICFDDTPDRRYTGGMTNAVKTQYICHILGYPPNGFDLDLPFPVEDWMASDDQSLINCGLYLNDLRSQFYQAMMRESGATRGSLFLKHGNAEFWRFAFNAESHQRLMGNILMDDRTLN